jgi:hypothetical protein
VKNVYCWHCKLYTGAVNFCLSASKWIHLDRFNRITTYAATENGATPTHPNDLDNQDEIIRVKNKEKAERKKQAQATQELMLKRDAEEAKRKNKKMNKKSWFETWYGS